MVKARTQQDGYIKNNIMHCILIYCCFFYDFVEEQIINGCLLNFIIISE